MTGPNANGLPCTVALCIVEEKFQRTVGPRTPRGQSLSSILRLYRELILPLVSRLLSLSLERPVTLLLALALGSGVGSLVVQTAPQSGYSAFGVKLMEKPRKWRACIARRRRCAGGCGVWAWATLSPNTVSARGLTRERAHGARRRRARE